MASSTAADPWYEGKRVLEGVPWKPDSPLVQFSNAFCRTVDSLDAKADDGTLDFEKLHQLSIKYNADFYRCFIAFAGIRLYNEDGSILTDTNFAVTNREAAARRNESTTVGSMPITGLTWLPNIRVNYAENILRNPQASIIFRAEPGSGIPRRHIPHRLLYAWVARVSDVLRTRLDLGPGEHVVGYLPNIPEAIVAMLAVTSLGGIWASCSPDFGEDAVLDRFGQLQPRLLITADAVVFKGKRYDCLGKARAIASRLKAPEPDHQTEGIPVWVVPLVETASALRERLDTAHMECFPEAPWMPLETDTLPQIPFRTIRFDRDPVVTMFSSGTTGKPKCLAQGAGILLTQEKEQLLHYAMQPGHVLCFYTTCGWMMWNWSVAALARGCCLVLYDGAAVWPSTETTSTTEHGSSSGMETKSVVTTDTKRDSSSPDLLWRIITEEGVTHFGCGAKFLQIQEQLGVRPAVWPLRQLKAVLVTGSPSTVANFRYVWEHVGRHVQYWSMSGGTDINGCFALGLEGRAIHAGELQSRALGLDVQVFDPQGRALENQDGELVCTNACPSMPLFFWHDTPDAAMYRAAYFTTFGPEVWHHGDFARLVVREPGHQRSVIIRGRSDATLKPGGVRLGSADFYSVLEQIPSIVDALVVGQRWQDDMRIILFVKLDQETPIGPLKDQKLYRQIVERLRNSLSPRHIPQEIMVVPGIPYTLNMKKMEVAVKRILDDLPLDNSHVCAEPALLDLYRELKRMYLEQTPPS
jgi:acetoacetyl-CoA synthetase